MSGTPPVIIVGMHRSGTSMLTRTLQGFGFFMGRGTTRNEECRWTNALNYWVFYQSSATWDRPAGVDTLLADGRVRPFVVDYIRGVTDGPASARFLGLTRWLRHRSMHCVPGVWGWKDPRNTYTLPLWLEVFPDARVLHITRHGVDVAESLRVRHNAAFETTVERYQRRRWLYLNNPLAPKSGGFAQAASVASLDYGLDLWGEYTRRARQHVESLGERALEVRYEDLLAHPQFQLERILAFCGLKPGTEAVRRQAQLFKPDRMFAYRTDEELVAFAESRRDVLESLGYAEGAA